MENFVAELEARRSAELEARRSAELEAYLSATGLKDYTLTAEEQQALAQLECNKTIFSSFSFDNVFDQIKQGRRLKKDDQIAGHIPFVMAGVTNTGVVGYIANPVARFPKNSITLDIFGNAFYRNYNYGAGDDTGVYWNSERNFSKEIMLFLTTSMQKAVEGQFSYGKKLRSSQSLKIKMQLPQKHNSPDYAYMQTLLSAVQKLVIKDVVQYADKKIAATQSVIQQNNQESR
ncbi:type IIS restriction enzyme R protein [Neisseria weaveri ATCC 51223]|nr:type IIS restriction enzyme R protein [Neisseria weaveri ATCC 51223]